MPEVDISPLYEAVILVNQKKTGAALNIVYRQLDSLLRAKEYDSVNKILQIAANDKEVQPGIIIGMLTVTYMWSKCYGAPIEESRLLLGERIKSELPDEQEELLSGFFDKFTGPFLVF